MKAARASVAPRIFVEQRIDYNSLDIEFRVRLLTLM
jgi:hypothetical protein